MLDHSSPTYLEFGGKHSCEVSVIICQTELRQIPFVFTTFRTSNFTQHFDFHRSLTHTSLSSGYNFRRSTGASCFSVFRLELPTFHRSLMLLCLQAITSDVTLEPHTSIFRLELPTFHRSLILLCLQAITSDVSQDPHNSPSSGYNFRRFTRSS
jgi:hypothetical protein